jgi:AcrR family transcriptional regulator
MTLPRRAAAEKRARIIEAAESVFQAEGLEGASLRSIAAKAGYTPAALYFHFDSKEALYAALLHAALARCQAAVEGAIGDLAYPAARLRAAAMAVFQYYADQPRDLDLGFYLFRGGMSPKGLGRERDRALNADFAATLEPITQAAEALGLPADEAGRLTADIFAHAAGLLLMAHTGRIRLFGASPASLMSRYLDLRIGDLARH